jgi:DNA invertase Pin-like site-specific DNA recombinase
MNATAWLLAVVSSDGQAETLDFQERWGRQAAAENGWTIERTFKDVSSGRDGARQLLKNLLQELRDLPKSARPARVLLVRIDRLGRGDGLEIIATISEIKRLGVGLFTRDDGELKLERASDALMPAMKSILAGIENEVRADRTRAGLARRKSTRPPSRECPLRRRPGRGKTYSVRTRGVTSSRALRVARQWLGIRPPRPPRG